LTSTGFKLSANANYEDGNTKVIYIAIRRPMKPPTTGTEVFSRYALDSGFVSASTFAFGDMAIALRNRFTAGESAGLFYDRLRGISFTGSGGTARQLNSTTSAAESSVTSSQAAGNNTTTNAFLLNNDLGVSLGRNFSATDGSVSYTFRRASGFFDVVCYTGTGSARTVNHNLTVAPELMIVKSRSLSASDWRVYSATTGQGQGLILNTTDAAFNDTTTWANTAPTATTFKVGGINDVNGSGYTYVAYLFATVAGVSKVGSYTGTGTTNAINCGFSGGARFVMIKRTDSTGDWFVWDTARGIVSGNDPYLLLNSTAAEVTNTDYIDPSSAGFEISSSAPAAINASGGTYIYLAIA
jgi:hypothetical protein